MLFRSQLNDFYQHHVARNLNQFTKKPEEFWEKHKPNRWTRAATPALAASTWLERKTRLRSVESHRRMALDTSRPMRIRRQELFRGVMAGLKAEFSGWIDFAQRLPNLDLQLILEAAGVAVVTKKSTSNDANRTLADNVWRETDERPEIHLNPLVQGRLVNLTLFHELFHLTHPAVQGRGHAELRTPVEILATFFAREMLLPAPAAQNLLTTNVARFPDSLAESALRHSRREAFEFVFESSSDSHSLLQVVVPSPPHNPYKEPLFPSLDVLSASLFGENCYGGGVPLLSEFAISPGPQGQDAPILQSVTPDGLRGLKDFGKSVSQALQDAGVIDAQFDSFKGFLGSKELHFDAAVPIPKMHLKDVQIGGGQYFCLWAPTMSFRVYDPELDLRPQDCLIAIEDDDGSLAGRWLQNQAQGHPGGPLALPADLVDDKRRASFDDWAVAIEVTFLKPPSLDAKAQMMLWQARYIAYRLIEGDEMTACGCGNPDCPTFQLANEIASRVRAEMELDFDDDR